MSTEHPGPSGFSDYRREAEPPPPQTPYPPQDHQQGSPAGPDRGADPGLGHGPSPQAPTYQWGGNGATAGASEAYARDGEADGSQRVPPQAPFGAASQQQNSHADAPPQHPEGATGIPIEVALTDPVPGFSKQANDCVNKAAQFAYHLNHASMGADHLMLALTLDQNARKTLETFGDIRKFRESAARILGETNWKFLKERRGADKFEPSVAADLMDIFDRARKVAYDRGQEVAVSDLVNAFPKDASQTRLLYGARDDTELIPRVVDRIEKDLASSVAALMDTYRKELLDTTKFQLTALLNDFSIALNDRLDEIAPLDDEPLVASEATSGDVIGGPARHQETEALTEAQREPANFWERCGLKRQ